MKSLFWALREAENMSEAKRVSEQIENILSRVNQSALKSYLEAKEDLLALHSLNMSLPLKKFFSTTNPIESLNSLLEEDLRRVKRWRNSENFQRWFATAALHNEKRMRRIHGYKGLDAVWIRLKNIFVKETQEKGAVVA